MSKSRTCETLKFALSRKTSDLMIDPIGWSRSSTWSINMLGSWTVVLSISTTAGIAAAYCATESFRTKSVRLASADTFRCLTERSVHGSRQCAFIPATPHRTDSPSRPRWGPPNANIGTIDRDLNSFAPVNCQGRADRRSLRCVIRDLVFVQKDVSGRSRFSTIRTCTGPC